MANEFNCCHCNSAIALAEGTHETSARCPSCLRQVEVPNRLTTVQSAGTAAQQTGTSGAIGWIAGGVFAIGVVIAWLGWTTFTTIILWAIILIAVLAIAGTGLNALGSPTKETKETFIGVAVVCAIAIVLAFVFMPRAKTKDGPPTDGGPYAAPIVTDAMLRDRLVGVWATQYAADAIVLYTFRTDGSFLRRFQSNNPLKDVGAMVFGADQITGQWSIHNRRLYAEWSHGGDFNPASGVLKGTMTGGYVQHLTDSTLVVPGLETTNGVFRRVQ